MTEMLSNTKSALPAKAAHADVKEVGCTAR